LSATEESRIALDLPLDDDISGLSRELHRRRIPHRVYEQGGRQVLEVLRTDDVAVVQAAHRAWRLGALPASPTHRVERGGAVSALTAEIRRTPAVAVVVALAIVLFPATWPLANDALGFVLPWLTIVPVALAGDGLVVGTLTDALTQGQVWRLFTPAWLHFSFAHLAFNAALVVFFGRRIEAGAGALAFVACVAAIAAVSNVTQYLAGDSPLFGGLSGVTYGLFGFVVVRGRQRPDDVVWRLPVAFVVLMVLSLAVMASGVTEPFGLTIANAAHVSGLACGAACALVIRPAQASAT
jgi:GlpG protein